MTDRGGRSFEVQTDRRIVYLAKMPPSISGVARYAEGFSKVLNQLGPVVVVNPGGDPQGTRSLRTTIRTIRALHRAVRHHRADLVVAELSGGCIAEVFALLLLTRAFKRQAPQLWLTAHDCPALTGGLFNFLELQFKGGRRACGLLSQHIGNRLERRLLLHADRVFALSTLGADALAARYRLDRAVERLPFLREVSDEQFAKSETVFIPGPIGADSATNVIDIVGRVAPDWTTLVGFGHPEEVRRTLEHCELSPHGPVQFLGLLAQEQLGETYGRAAVVVKLSSDHNGARPPENWAACSGPILDALAAGCALVTNNARGSRELLDDSVNAIDLTDSPSALEDRLTELLQSPTLWRTLGKNGRALIEERHSSLSVLKALRCIEAPKPVRATEHRA